MSRYLLSVIGQSNEVGAGPSGSGRVTAGHGAPYMREIGGNTRGMWPSASEAMARRRCWLTVVNTAVGVSSLTEQWVGRCRAWSSGQAYGLGGYALQGGNVFKKTSADVQTSTTAPAAGTGADGITWALARAATAADTNGAIYGLGDALHDPNGYLAAALAAVDGRPGYTERGVLISIGQTDHSVGSTRAQYAQAMLVATQRILAVGARAWLGMTCYMAGDSAREATMQSVLLPGRADVLAKLQAERMVSHGADLRSALGVLSTGGADHLVGLRSDGLHLTSGGLEEAGVLQAEAFAAAWS